ELPTGALMDPNRDDPILSLATERIRLERETLGSEARRARLSGLLKGMTNALSSGLPIQVNDDEPTATLRQQTVYDARSGTAETKDTLVRETPGSWYFPPIAAGVTAAARLLLRLVIEAVRTRGGIVCYWDTDSVFVLATPGG